MPKVSVIIPTFNRAHLILETLESVFAQTFTEYEVIVVDDGSTDDTLKKLQSLVDDNSIRYVHQKNAGLPAARNTGIRHAEGAYIALLDSDDLYLPHTLALQVDALEKNPQAGLVHGDFSKFMHADKKNLGTRDTSFFSGHIYPKMLLQWESLMASPCVMFRKSITNEIGWFDETLTWAEDLDYWRRIARHYSFVHIPETLAEIRVHADSMSADKTKAAPQFLIYLQKAFDEDASLPPSFRRQVLAKMYTNVGHNLLGAGGNAEMKLARQYFLTALGQWPLAWGAYSGWGASLLNHKMRSFLAGLLRKARYQNKQVKE